MKYLSELYMLPPEVKRDIIRLLHKGEAEGHLHFSTDDEGHTIVVPGPDPHKPANNCGSQLQ